MGGGLARPALVACLLAALAAALPPAAAGARTSVEPTVTTSNGVTRLAVTITTTGRFSARTRPRAVTVRYRRKTYKLRAVRTRASRATSTWRSSAYRGSRGRAVARLAGKRVKVSVKSRARTTSFSRRVEQELAETGPPGSGPNPPDTGTPPPPGAQPLFAAPPRELTGQEAYSHFQRYFVDSRFTDCPAGWPNCAVEERYNHCPDGSWEYRRLTPSSGSDINSFGAYQVTGAVARTDGSWGVEYYANEERTQFYSWNVAADGTVTGNYFFDGQFSQTLGPLSWQQPAGCS